MKELHHRETEIFFNAEFMNRKNVWMGKSGDGLGFPAPKRRSASALASKMIRQDLMIATSRPKRRSAAR